MAASHPAPGVVLCGLGGCRFALGHSGAHEEQAQRVLAEQEKVWEEVLP